jgi:hypothetical protein
MAIETRVIIPHHLFTKMSDAETRTAQRMEEIVNEMTDQGWTLAHYYGDPPTFIFQRERPG